MPQENTTQPKAAAPAKDEVEVTAIKAGWKHKGEAVPIGETVTVNAAQAALLRSEKFVK